MEYKFTRRRYGHITFTWVFVLHRGIWLSLGDPWQAINPRRSELDAAARAVIAAYK